MSSEVTERAPGPVLWRLTPSWKYAYAYVFFISVFVGQTIRFFVGSEPWVGAQPAQILIPLVTFAASVVLWVLSPLPIRLPPRHLAIFFGLLILIWLWAVIRDWGAIDLTAFTLGPFLAMLATKTPTPTCALRVLNTLCVFVLILYASAAVFAIVTDVPPTGFTTKWPPLTNPFDPIGMWWAPFNGPAEAGAIGAVLIVLGFGQRRRLSILFVIGGGVILFYAGTLAAALGLGGALLILFFGHARTSHRKRFIQFGALALAFLGLAVLIQELVRNPTLSARTYIWSDFLALLRVEPIRGWGSAALIDSESTWTFPWGESRNAHGSDAHNMLLDAWVRFGMVGLVLVLIVCLLAVAIAAKSWRRGDQVGPALIALTLLIGVTESNVWWGSPSTAVLVFVLAALVASETVKVRRTSTWTL